MIRFRPPLPLRRLLLTGMALTTWLAWPLAGHAANEPTVFAVGAGVQRLPAWPGADSTRSEPLPYFDFEWGDRFSLSTLDGLHVDLIGGQVLHGGVYGNYQWGRSSDDLGQLRRRIRPLSPRLTLGGYLDWQLTARLDVGSDLSHDLAGAGAYWRVYADLDLPPIGLLQHSLEVSWQAMNQGAMRRFFGIDAAQANDLGVAPWDPGAGQQLAILQYQLFMPTSRHTGVAAAISWGRLLGGASGSPLVSRFGSRNQVSESLAFVYHL